MALLVPRQTQKLYLPTTLPGITDGDWVEIVTTFTAGMRGRIMRRGITSKFLDGKPDVDVDVFASRQAVLEEVIVSWSEPTPVSPKAIGEMHPDIQDWIAVQYDQIVAGRSEEEKKDSNGNSASGPEPPATSLMSLII